jgi:autotransporter passenger strand-loop-strand repeat protein/T5SS/PEP-CTERM-associated repeat protein
MTGINITVSSGGSENVYAGQTTTSTTVLSGGRETVFDSGTAVSTTVNAGGFEQVSSGGTTIGTMLSSGGYESLSGSSISTTVGSGGGEVVDIGGTATATTVDSGGYLIVVPGGSATDTVSAGGTVISTGVAAAAPGGSLAMDARSVSGLTGGNNGTEWVLPGGTLISATANSGNDVAVYAGGQASATTVNSGGWQDIYATGTASGTVVDGGTEFVHSGGLAISTTLNLAGSAYADSAGAEYVYSGGVASAVTVNAGAQQDVQYGGSAFDTLVNSGGFENVSGGTTSHTEVYIAGFELVWAGGTASSTDVNLWGALVVFSGGTADDTAVGGGGVLLVLPGGTASGTIGSSAVSTGVVTYQPGDYGLGYASTISGSAVSSGGTEFILPGGTATDTTLMPGGTIDVTTLPYVSGGSVTLDAATRVLTATEGGASYTQQMAGSYTDVGFSLSPDGNGTGTCITEAANVTIAPGATVTAGALTAGETIAFAGSGTPGVLILDSPTATISNPITGFAAGDRIEFANGATVTAASVLNGDTLAVSYHIGAGNTLVCDFTNVTFSPSQAPLSMRIAFDDITNDYYVVPTTYLVWTGASSTSFNTASNWSSGTIVPSVADFGLFNSALGGTISGAGTIEGFNFANSGTWTLSPGTDLIAIGAVAIGNGGGGTNSPGALIIGSGATITTPGGFINVGANPGNVANLTVSGGGLLEETAADNPNNYIMTVGAGGASGTLAASSDTVLVTGTGSLLDLPFNGIEIGNNGGSGSVTVSQGGSILATTQDSNDSNSLAIGRTGNGTLTVTGSGSQLTAVGVAYVAHSQTGTLTVENQGTVLLEPDATGQAGITIGSGNTVGVGGTGVATVMTGGDLISQGFVAVGLYGTTGQLNVSNSGTVQVGTTLTVGIGGTIQTDGSYAGNGTLTIGAGGTVELTGGAQTASFGVLLASSNNGQITSSDAVVSVSGAGALLNTDGNGIGVGQYGSASLTVSQGGSVSAGTANSGTVAALGIGRQGSGTVTVTDAGSQLTANGEAWVGRAGNGSLIIENLGSVLIGVDGTGAGGITIGGAGLSNGDTLFTGGTGVASVTTGGYLSSTQAVTVGRNGTAGSLLVTGGTVLAGTGLVIGASTTLAAGDYDDAGNRISQVTSARVFNGNGTVTVGTGGLIQIEANGTVAAGVVIGSAAGATGDLNVSGGTVLAADGLSMFQGSTVSVSAGGIDVGSSGAIITGAINVDSGYAITGDGLVHAIVNNSGTIQALAAGTLEVSGTVAGSGTLDLAAGSTLRLDGGIATSQSVVFASGTPETLILGAPGNGLSNSISGLDTGDLIEFGNGMTITGASLVNETTIALSFNGSGGSPGVYDLTDAGFAAWSASTLTIGTDTATGDDYVAVGAAAFPLTISGTVADQAISGEATIMPLSSVTVVDQNVGQTDTVTVALSAAANGTLSNLAGGSYTASTGVYTITGSATAVTAALDGLVFTPRAHQVPQGQTVTTTFTITDTDTLGESATNGTTTVIATAAAAPPVVLNTSGGTSYLYTYFPSSTVAETIASYSGPNSTGSLLADIVDNTDGTSTLYAYNPTSTVKETVAAYSATGSSGAPSGAQLSDVVNNTDGTCLVYAYNPTATVTQTTQDWSATNAIDGAPAGTLLADVVDNIDGTCLVYAYNPTSQATQTTQNWSATNTADGSPAGMLLGDVVDNTNGTCMVYAYNPIAGVTQTTQYWSAIDPADGAPAGTQFEEVVDNTDGTSIVYTYSPTDDRVTQTATYYSFYDAANGAPAGWVTSETLDYANGQSAITTYNANGTASTVDYSGPDGSGSVISSITQAAGGEAVSAAASPDVITISGSGQLIDPGKGSHTIQFASGAADDTLVLHLGGSDQITGFDPAAGDVLNLTSLLSEAGVSLGSDLSHLANYVSVADVNGSAEVLFDPSGHGGGSQVALLENGAGLVTLLQTLKAFET